MRAHLIILIPLLSLASAIGCKGKGNDANPSGSNSPAGASGSKNGPPLEIEWVKDDKFQVKGSPKQYGEAGIFRGTYQVTMYGFPKGTKWSALDKKGIIDSETYNILKIVDM